MKAKRTRKLILSQPTEIQKLAAANFGQELDLLQICSLTLVGLLEEIRSGRELDPEQKKLIDTCSNDIQHEFMDMIFEAIESEDGSRLHRFADWLARYKKDGREPVADRFRWRLLLFCLWWRKHASGIPVGSKTLARSISYKGSMDYLRREAKALGMVLENEQGKGAGRPRKKLQTRCGHLAG